MNIFLTGYNFTYYFPHGAIQMALSAYFAPQILNYNYPVNNNVILLHRTSNIQHRTSHSTHDNISN